MQSTLEPLLEWTVKRVFNGRRVRLDVANGINQSGFQVCRLQPTPVAQLARFPVRTNPTTTRTGNASSLKPSTCMGQIIFAGAAGRFCIGDTAGPSALS
jgi:hypothetical protein